MPWISGSGGGLLESSLSNALPIQAIAAGLSIVDEGLQIDAITSYDPEKLTEAQRTRLQNASQASRIAQLMPADTILLYTAQEIQGAVEAIPEALADRSNEALLLSTLLGEIGFELEPVILSYLNKEYGLAVVPETGGALAVTARLALHRVPASSCLHRSSGPRSCVRFIDASPP